MPDVPKIPFPDIWSFSFLTLVDMFGRRTVNQRGGHLHWYHLIEQLWCKLGAEPRLLKKKKYLCSRLCKANPT